MVQIIQSLCLAEEKNVLDVFFFFGWGEHRVFLHDTTF